MQYSRRVRKFQTKKGFTLTKFLQEKHTSLRGTISDVTQINVNLQKKRKITENQMKNITYLDE